MKEHIHLQEIDRKAAVRRATLQRLLSLVEDEAVAQFRAAEDVYIYLRNVADTYKALDNEGVMLLPEQARWVLGWAYATVEKMSDVLSHTYQGRQLAGLAPLANLAHDDGRRSFTVIVALPDYRATHHAESQLVHLRAVDEDKAADEACKQAAIRFSGGPDEADQDNAEDYTVLAMFAGHHNDIKPTE